MSRSISVSLGEEGRGVGLLRYDQQGQRESSAFEYGEEWLVSGQAFALGPSLPLVRGPQFHKRQFSGSVFAGAIADTEPDGWGKRVILRDHARRRAEQRRAGLANETRALNSLDFLLAVDDASRVGALRFRDEQGTFQRAAEPGRQTTPPLIELSQLLSASHAVEMNEETARDLAYLRGRGTSLGGLRPKCSVLDDDGVLAIAKFPSVSDERTVTTGEVLALRLARAAGINAAEARLIDSGGSSVALIQRFDRVKDGGRLMYSSATTMLGAANSEEGEHSYTEIADALRRHGVQPKADIEELWRRIAFSILITNVDDHLNNHGFLHVDRGLWRLSPAFDINPFPERLRELKTWISEDAGPEASIEGLMSVIAYFQIKPERARDILREVEQAVASWRQEARSLGMTARDMDSFADAFEHRERATAQRLIA